MSAAPWSPSRRPTRMPCSSFPRANPFPTAACASRTMTTGRSRPHACRRVVHIRTREGDHLCQRQNYYPHDLEAIAQRAPGLELGKVVAAGVRARGAQIEQLVVFVLHRGGLPEFLPVATQVARLINEQTGLEVTQVVPVKRIPKTTSGKIQRHLLEEGYADGEFEADLGELAALRVAERGPESGTRTEIEQKIKAICDAALEGKRVDIHDNLFEIGASSLKLIEIHEQIDHEYPGKVDLTELFDFPTIAELAQHLQGKLAQA